MSDPLLSVEEARERILALLPILPEESCPVGEAPGRALAVDVTARRTLPPWDNSAMDGYAVRSADAAAPPVRLRIIEAPYAGARPAREGGPGGGSRIMTGAPPPEGADAVLMQEKARRLPGSEEVQLVGAGPPRASVRDRGEDARAGE